MKRRLTTSMVLVVLAIGLTPAAAFAVAGDGQGGGSTQPPVDNLIMHPCFTGQKQINDPDCHISNFTDQQLEIIDPKQDIIDHMAKQDEILQEAINKCPGPDGDQVSKAHIKGKQCCKQATSTIVHYFSLQDNFLYECLPIAVDHKKATDDGTTTNPGTGTNIGNPATTVDPTKLPAGWLGCTGQDLLLGRTMCCDLDSTYPNHYDGTCVLKPVTDDTTVPVPPTPAQAVAAPQAQQSGCTLVADTNSENQAPLAILIFFIATAFFCFRRKLIAQQ